MPRSRPSSSRRDSRLSPARVSIRAGRRAIERQPRGTNAYERKLAALARTDRLTVELVQESILSDLGRTHRRRIMPDGTEIDLTAYDEWSVLLSFRRLASGAVEFIDFVIFHD
jgi:hypothetical protein